MNPFAQKDRKERNRESPRNDRPFGFYLNLSYCSSPILFVLAIIFGLILLIGFSYCWAVLLKFWVLKGAEYSTLFANETGFVDEIARNLTKPINVTTTKNATVLADQISSTIEKVFATDKDVSTLNETISISNKLTVVEEMEKNQTIMLLSKLESEDEPDHQTCDDDFYTCVTKAPWDDEKKMLPWTRRCDGLPQCWDQSDEKNCTKCLTFFSCPADDGIHLKCLHHTKICDKIADCTDFSDEILHCQKKDVRGNCPDSMFKCKYQDKCIPMSLRCDGNSDCERGGEDEEECEWCQPNARACGQRDSQYSKCVSVYKMCDGQSHCEDHRDEKFFHCNSTQNCPGSCKIKDYREANAEATYFSYLKQWMDKILGTSKNLHCSDGKWYNPLYGCNGENPQCDKQCKQCAPLAFRCATESKCIPRAKYHDGIKDCIGGSDEANCTVQIDCQDKSKRCDGFADCPDGIDEKGCDECSKKDGQLRSDRYYYMWDRNDEEKEFEKGGSMFWLNSLYNAYHCEKDKTCIPVQGRCDGRTDCLGGGEDENNCSCAECMMHPFKMYMCEKGNRCFRYDEVCDDKFLSKCPNATQLDKDHCELLKLGN